jgi:hypothetical protein
MQAWHRFAVVDLDACRAAISRCEARITFAHMCAWPCADAASMELIAVIFAVGTDIDLHSTVLSIEPCAA